MASEGFVVVTERFDRALKRLAATSRKSAVEVMTQQAKLLFALVAKITPPGNEFASGRAAEKQGKTAVAADIYAIYGTPSDAYDAIDQTGRKTDADAFWALYKDGQLGDAKEIFEAVTGSEITYGFDGGAAHRAAGIGARKRKNRRRTVFTFSVEGVTSHVKDTQASVWWLASGWARALRALGARLPTGTGKHDAPGSLAVIVNDALIDIKMTNRVKFAGQVPGIKRRIRSAMRIRAEVLQRQWDFHISRAARSAGFRTRGARR